MEVFQPRNKHMTCASQTLPSSLSRWRELTRTNHWHAGGLQRSTMTCSDTRDASHVKRSQAKKKKGPLGVWMQIVRTLTPFFSISCIPWPEFSKSECTVAYLSTTIEINSKLTCVFHPIFFRNLCKKMQSFEHGFFLWTWFLLFYISLKIM